MRYLEVCRAEYTTRYRRPGLESERSRLLRQKEEERGGGIHASYAVSLDNREVVTK